MPNPTFRSRLKRSGAVLGLIALLLVAFAGLAVAQEESYLDGKVRFGDELRISAGETVEGDVYLFGGSVLVEGTVDGDVIAFAGSVDVTGTVTGDVMIGAGTVDITGTVEGDVRASAGRLTITGPVGEDVVVGAGSVSITGSVGDDLIFGTGSMELTGNVDGSALGATGVYDKTGSVAGTERVQVDEPSTAKDDDEPNPFVEAFQRYIAVLLVALLVYWLLRRPVGDAVDRIRENWLRCLGFGLLAVVALLVAPIAVLIAGILLSILFALLGLGELVGLVVLAMLATFFFVGATLFVVGTFLAPIVVGLVIASYLLPDRAEGFGGWFLGVVVGALIVVALIAIPYVGWFIGVVAFAGTLGAFVLRFRRPQPEYLASDEAAMGGGEPPVG